MIFTITNLLDFQIINYLLLPFSDYGYLISLIFFMSAAIVGVVIVHFSARKGINALAKGAGYGFGLTAGHRAANIIADSLEGKDRGGSNNGSGDSSGSNSGSDNSKDSNSGSDNSKDSKTGSDNSKDSNNGSDNSKDSNSGSDNSKDSKPESNNSGSSNSGSK
jgi:hypothetical protein